MEDKKRKVPGTSTVASDDDVDVELAGRRRIHRLEEEKLKLTAAHNRQLSTLEAELARLRSAAERGDARGAELQLQVSAGRRDARRLSQSNRQLTERAAELLKILDLTRRARHQEGAALRQEADERHAMMEDLTSDGQRLRRLVQCQEEALEEARRTMAALRDQEVQGRQSLEAEREARREEERRRELAQAAEREALGQLAPLRAQLLEARRAHGEERDRGRRARRALRRLRTESERRAGDLSVAAETARSNAADLSGRLEEEERRHADTSLRLGQALKAEALSQKLLEEMGETLRRQVPPDARADGTDSGPGDVMRLLHLTLARPAEAERQVAALRTKCEEKDQRARGYAQKNGRYARAVLRLRGLLSRSRRKSAAFLWTCSLLLGATAHDRRRLIALAEQKRLLARRLAAAEEPAEELRRLADALAGGREAPPSAGVVGRRWKKYTCAVLALSRWRALGRRSAAFLWPDGDEPEGAVERRRRSQRFSSAVLTRVGEPPPPDASPSRVRSEARAALARLLHGMAVPSARPPDISREASPWAPPPGDAKAAASRLRRHFLLLSRRLHSAEVERRSLRRRVAQMGSAVDDGGTVKRRGAEGHLPTQGPANTG
ncbi:uncharacterized protein ccdc171 [Stigmatopora nigra]